MNEKYILKMLSLICIGFILSSCALINQDKTPKVVKSEDGKFELTIPSYWNGDEKDSFEDDMTLKEYSDLVVQGMKTNITNSEDGGTTEIWK